MAKKPGCMAVVFVVIGLLFHMIGGCMKKKYTPKEFEQMALDYMKERYQDSEDVFTVVYSNWDSKEFEVWMTSEKYEKADIRVRWNFERREFNDNYLAYILKDEVEEKYLEVFAKVYGEENIRLEYKPGVVLPAGIGVRLPVDISVEEFLPALRSLKLHVLCVGNPEEKEEKMQEVLDTLYEKGWGMDCRIIYVDAQEVEDWREIPIDRILYQKRYILFGDVFFVTKEKSVMLRWKEKGKNGY